MDFAEVMQGAPQNDTIIDALSKCYRIVQQHDKILCSISGGADSDIMLDMLLRCGGREKTTFVFFDTGLEYQATKDHIKHLQDKYGIEIQTHKAVKSIPTACSECGQPFVSKYVSGKLYTLQRHGFAFENLPYETLAERYPKCIAAIRWWCNFYPVREGYRTTSFNINRNKWLKQFIVAHPPTFKISAKCCDYAKKRASHKVADAGGYDLKCTGIRRAEGGVRAISYKSCYDEVVGGVDLYRPIFWFTDADKQAYSDAYGITHSRCYTEWGFKRTGCSGCPFARDVQEERNAVAKYEPKLAKAIEHVFADSYAYTEQYRAFCKRMEEQCTGQMDINDYIEEAGK